MYVIFLLKKYVSLNLFFLNDSLLDFSYLH